MSKLNLVAMSYDRDGILNALQRTGAVEIKDHSYAENTVEISADCEELKSYLSRTESALDAIYDNAVAYEKENSIKSAKKAGAVVSYTRFMSAGEYRERADKVTELYEKLEGEKRELSAERTKLLRTLYTAEIYSCVESPLTSFADTAHAKIRLGTIPVSRYEALLKYSEENLIGVEVLNLTADSALIVFACHKSENGEAVLQDFEFTPCPFKNETRTGARVYADIKAEIDSIDKRLKECEGEFYALSENIEDMRVYCDRVRFELEKAEAGAKMRGTDATFLLEAYLPKDKEEEVKNALEEVSGAVYYEFSEPAEDEVPPTLYRNNAVVKSFESVTNMYSPASSREFDPNTVMGFFYSLFLGFIMADWGYGLIMFLGAGAIWIKTRAKDTGLTRLSGVFAIGGIFTILWGILFNSFFGANLLPFTVMPDARGDMWQFMGITMPALLIISMIIGVVHLMTGYVCRAVQCWRNGDFWDGVWDGVVWALFSVGVGLAIVGLVDNFNLRILAFVGGIIAGVSLVMAMLTAGRKEKIIGKFTKGFGAAYGVINYASDILSYARLFGLMLSGAVIAQIITGYAVTGVDGGIGFLQSGNPAMIILGVILLIVGHVFNLAMSLLGAYIHDARLQYVEFYGKFFTGEGELFTPLGSTHKYITLENGKLSEKV